MYKVATIYKLRNFTTDLLQEIAEAQDLCREVGAMTLEAKLLLMLAQVYLEDIAQTELPNRDHNEALPEAFLEQRSKAHTAVKDALLLAGKSGDRSLRAAALFW